MLDQVENEQIKMTQPSFKHGDLVMTMGPMVVRRDGLTFDESDCDPSGKIPRDWLNGADELEKGAFCSYVGPADDEGYAIVSKGMGGRAMFVKLDRLVLVSSVDEAVE